MIGLRAVQKADKTVFLGVSVRVVKKLKIQLSKSEDLIVVIQ